MHEIRTDGDVERVRSWASIIEENTMQQALCSSRSPAVSGPIALMPDAHYGSGATVGSVIPTKNAIIPATVGVDLGCGMAAVHFDLRADQLPDDLGGLLAGIEQSIPAGVGNWHGASSRAAERWYRANPVPASTELDTKSQKKLLEQLGTLGGGNHFVELCLDENDSVWLVLHSGSRGIGNSLATGHISKAKNLAKDLERRLDDPDLAYFLDTDEGFNAYIADMLWSQDYAAANREIMLDEAVKVVRSAGISTNVVERINCHHNYTEREVHGGDEMWITRKGAIRAAVGDMGVIPGSMGTETYVVAGKGNPLSYNSASHGAGRRFGRKEAERRFTVDEFKAAMKGRTWQSDKAKALIDESPMAYKDISKVMADQSDLVEIRHVLRAVLNYKGTK